MPEDIILHLCTTNDNHVVWFLIYQARQTEFFVILGYFLSFYPSNNPENQILKKWKKFLEILSFTQVYHKWQSYDIWLLRYQLQQTDFLSSLVMFCPFTPLTAPKMKIPQNWKKAPGDIIILHKCTKNHDHMLYSSWAMVCVGCNCYFWFWIIFNPFTPLTAQKMKISKKWRKQLEISSFYTSVPKIMIIGYTVPEIWHMTDVIIIFLGYFLPFYPLTDRKMKMSKKLKSTSRYHHFTKVYQNSWSYAILLLRYGTWQM